MKSENPEGALDAFKAIVEQEPEKGEWYATDLAFNSAPTICFQIDDELHIIGALRRSSNVQSCSSWYYTDNLRLSRRTSSYSPTPNRLSHAMYQKKPSMVSLIMLAVARVALRMETSIMMCWIVSMRQRGLLLRRPRMT
jgi:hypothetical protein